MESFNTLLALAKQGDESSILKIIEIYKPAILKNSMLGGTFDEDLKQQLIVTLLKCIQTFKD